MNKLYSRLFTIILVDLICTEFLLQHQVNKITREKNKENKENKRKKNIEDTNDKYIKLLLLNDSFNLRIYC